MSSFSKIPCSGVSRGNPLQQCLQGGVLCSARGGGGSPAVVSPGEIPCTGSLQEENSQHLRNGYLFLGFLPFKCCQETMTNIIVRKTESILQMTYRICLCVPFKVSSPLQLPAALHSPRKGKVNCRAIARGKNIHRGENPPPVQFCLEPQGCLCSTLTVDRSLLCSCPDSV